MNTRAALGKRALRVAVAILCGVGVLFVLLLVGASTARRVREHDEPPSVSPESKVVLADDLRMHYSELGPSSGDVIVFIHGTGAYGELWRDVMVWFAARGYRIIAVDLPPFGFSEKPSVGRYGNAAQAARLVSLLDQLRIERVTLFGHSFGGGATLETALRIPTRVRCLILEDIGGLHLGETPASEADERGSAAGANGKRGSAAGADGKRSGAEAAVEWLLRTPTLRDPLLALTATNPWFTRSLLESMVWDPTVVSDEHVAILQRPLALRGGTHAFGDWLHTALFPARASLTSDRANYAKLGMPALIVWGEQDSIIPLSTGRELTSLLPNAQLRTLPNVNHIPHLENFPAVTEMGLAFIEASRER